MPGEFEATAERSDEQAGRLTRWRPAIELVGAYVVVRLLTLLVIVLAHINGTRPWPKVLFPWDAGSYLEIAQQGYPPSPPDAPARSLTGAFFPLFPLTVRGLSWLLHAPAAAVGIALNLALGGLAVVVVYLLAADLMQRETAYRATMLFVAMPGGVIVAFFYADALLVSLAAAALLMLRSQRWLAAGLLGMGATATRPNAAGLVAAAAAACYLALHREGDRRSLLAAALTPLGAIMYLTYLGIHTHDPLAWFHIQGHWDQSLDFGYHYGHVLKNPAALQDATWRVMAFGFVFLILAAWCVWKGARLDAVTGTYTVTLVLQMLLFSGVSPRPRFLLTAFPLTFLLAQRMSRRWCWLLAGIGLVSGAVIAYVYAREIAVP